MKRLARAILQIAPIAFVGAGCMPGHNGIWLVLVPELPEPECEMAPVDHNFVGAEEPEEETEDPWTEEITEEYTPGSGFAQIFDVGGGEEKKIMVFQGLTYLGTVADGVWTFTWTNSSTETTTDTHETGYQYSQSLTGAFTTHIDLTFKGNTATGTVGIEVHQQAVITESDTWDTGDTGVMAGNIPAGAFLVDDEGNYVWNSAEDAECSGDPCELTITQDCASTGDIEARETHYDEDGYEGINEAYNPPGTPDY